MVSGIVTTTTDHRQPAVLESCRALPGLDGKKIVKKNTFYMSILNCTTGSLGVVNLDFGKTYPAFPL